MNRRAALLALVPLVLTAGCAFTRRENRPVWNAFEQHLVPEETGWFLAALPLTVPGGILAILSDTFVAHPIQVADDAWDDAEWLWRDGRPDFEERYYSEMAFLPVRAAVTPVTFVGSFLGRSMFDIGDDAAREAERAEARAKQRAEFAAWLQALAQGGTEAWYGAVPELDPELRPAVLAARQQGNALGRLQLYRLARGSEQLRAMIDPLDGLEDPDPYVRFDVLERLPRKQVVAPELRAALLQDPVESVRLLARERWPDG